MIHIYRRSKLWCNATGKQNDDGGAWQPGTRDRKAKLGLLGRDDVVCGDGIDSWQRCRFDHEATTCHPTAEACAQELLADLNGLKTFSKAHHILRTDR